MRNGMFESVNDFGSHHEVFRASIIPFSKNYGTPVEKAACIEHFQIIGAPFQKQHSTYNSTPSYWIPVKGMAQYRVDSQGVVAFDSGRIPNPLNGVMSASDAGITSKPYNDHRTFETLQGAAEYIRWFFNLPGGFGTFQPPAQGSGVGTQPTATNSTDDFVEDPIKAYERAMKSLR